MAEPDLEGRFTAFYDNHHAKVYAYAAGRAGRGARALKSWLLRYYTGHDTETVNRSMTADAYLFQVTSGLITQAPVTPEVRAAAFKMLAALPSVKVLGKRPDSQGRTGVALTLPMNDAVSGHELIIAPAT